MDTKHRKKVIEIKNLNKIYTNGDSEFYALKNIDLSIEEGKFVSIIGPSGSGKSTLMNIIGGLDRFSSGDLLLDGISVANMSDDELAKWRGEKIGFVFQSFNLLEKYTVLENVLLPSLYVPITNAKDRALDIIKKVGLQDKVQNTPARLSGGQKQRVAIARALLVDPVVVLADEPTGNLDQETGNNILSLFEDLNKQGKTIILITHDEKVAKRAKRIIKIVDGRISNE